MKKLQLNKKELEEIRLKTRKAIKKWVTTTGAMGVVYGLSGGLDSAVVSTLTAEAKVNAHALIMPEEGLTDPGCVDDAVKTARKLKVKHTIMPINTLLEAYKKHDIDVENKIAWGNVKARVRMTLNYLVANTENRVVLGTGNRTELLLGYYTKYGDGGVDFQPIGSLYKTHVRQLARHIGIPKRIINKTPTAGLWDKQTDEKELGVDYKTLDKILFLLVEEWLSIKETSSRTGASTKKVKEIADRIQKNRHKLEGPQILLLD
jgi:NAD+ synthase